MADKFPGGIRAGSTSVSTTVLLRSIADGTEVTGKVAADMTCSYMRQGGLRVAITPSDLAAVNSAYSSGGVKEVDSTNMPGLYRLDLPDAAVATTADWVMVAVKVTGAFVYHERFPLSTDATSTASLAAIKAKTDSLTFTTANKVDSTIQAAGDLTQAAADKVWASASRTLSAFGFTVTLATNVWEEVAASHNTAGTTGAKLNSAAAAADPWGAPLPGAYVAGEAGFILASLGGDSADIDAIKAKTDQITFTTPNVVDASSTGGLTAADIATAVLTTVMTEGYAAKGAQATLTQAVYIIMQYLYERSSSGTTETIKKLDSSTTAATNTLNSATNPTAVTRTT